MSGICGICQPGAAFSKADLEPILSALALSKDQCSKAVAGPSAALGVVQRWLGQEAAQVDGVRIAVDGDLLGADSLRKLLQDKGIVNEDVSQATLLARLYRLLGPQFVARLGGAFSLALWDDRAARLLLAIDRLGMKSLYWSREGGRLLFASRASAILTVLERPAEANPAAIMQYLLFSVVPAPHSAYRGIERLRPGFVLLYEDGQVHHRQYWDLEYAEEETQNVDCWAERVREGMRAAVYRHLDGCAPETTGAYLSGGTDSSSIVAFMSERMPPVHTFSIGFPETRYNEIGFARTTAGKFRTRHHERCLAPADIREAIPRVTAYYDEPFANSSALASYWCARLARENGIEMMLAGDGGDELFAGNSRYAEDKRFSLYQSVPRWVRQGVLEPIAELLPQNDGWLGKPRRYIRRANISNPRRIFSYGIFLSLPPEEVFEATFLKEAPPQEWMNIAERHFLAAQASSELNRLLYLDVKMILGDNDLRKVNGTAELAGVRVRFPLLDHNLVELSGKIPAKWKLKGFEKRYIFKQAMKNILPERVLYKKKHGFGVPLGQWVLQDAKLKELVQDVLSESRTRQRGYFRGQFIDRIAELHRTDHAAFYGEIVWYLVVLELWHREHLEAHKMRPMGRN